MIADPVGITYVLPCLRAAFRADRSSASSFEKTLVGRGAHTPARSWSRHLGRLLSLTWAITLNRLIKFVLHMGQIPDALKYAFTHDLMPWRILLCCSQALALGKDGLGIGHNSQTCVFTELVLGVEHRVSNADSTKLTLATKAAHSFGQSRTKLNHAMAHGASGWVGQYNTRVVKVIVQNNNFFLNNSDPRQHRLSRKP